MRGNLRGSPRPAEQLRSIPARAGEPPGPCRLLGRLPVYPRACGGTLYRWDIHPRDYGLSPRVRGNLHAKDRAYPTARSIPARAGEPSERVPERTSETVYPRACGGTEGMARMELLKNGLSPRVRGNPPSLAHYPIQCGSIPARAGEPLTDAMTRPPSAVYPRACGGTWGHIQFETIHPGLSPRVRGNRLGRTSGMLIWRSIPARAGEPRTARRGRADCWVYPRACGGTTAARIQTSALTGLSPRVRGNPPEQATYGLEWRSIPARAGEPSTQKRPGTGTPVYPRACGGTCQPLFRAIVNRGLSPRVRGNLRPCHIRYRC